MIKYNYTHPIDSASKLEILLTAQREHGMFELSKVREDGDYFVFHRDSNFDNSSVGDSRSAKELSDFVFGMNSHTLGKTVALEIVKTGKVQADTILPYIGSKLDSVPVEVYEAYVDCVRESVETRFNKARDEYNKAKLRLAGIGGVFEEESK